MKTVKEAKRKTLRYLMFCKKNGTKLDNPILGKKKDADVVKFFEKQEGFTSWKDFETKWDIGIGDDLVTKSNRKEKWFLFDADKTTIVFRPKDYWEKEALRKGVSVHTLYTQEHRQRGITLEQFFKLFF